MSAGRIFPLDAEQIVRGVGWLAAQWIDRGRRPGDDLIGAGTVTLTLADFMGVLMPTELDRLGRRRLLPYGAAITRPAHPQASSSPPERGGGDAG